jgi:hypothetical protein
MAKRRNKKKRKLNISKVENINDNYKFLYSSNKLF